jgi:hypothetical protein
VFHSPHRFLFERFDTQTEILNCARSFEKAGEQRPQVGLHDCCRKRLKKMHRRSADAREWAT